jgi:hypothetical protein
MHDTSFEGAEPILWNTTAEEVVLDAFLADTTLTVTK